MIPRFAYLLIIASIFALPHAGHATALPVCGQDQLSLGFDSENGNFDGMSHSGTLLVLRNLGPKPCQLPAFPKLSFEDSAKHMLNVATHPAGTKRPPRLAVGAEATATLCWVSSPVFTNNLCLKTASLSVSWSGGKLTQALAASICGPGGGPATITQSPLATVPAAPHG